MSKMSDQAMFEAGFDGDFSPERFDEMLSIFSRESEVDKKIREFRDLDGYVDLKRGELYPEVIGAGTRLRRVIAEVYGVSDGQKNVRAQPNFGCNGSIETIFAAIRNAEDAERIRRARAGERFDRDSFGGCVAATPSYFRYYNAAEAKGVRFIGVPYQTWEKYPVKEVLQCIRDNNPSLLILVSPNNPTGVPLTDDELHTLMVNIPKHLTVIIDRTCINVQEETSTAELLRMYEGRRFGVFHSFSKYKGMSHLRIGFAVYASEELAVETNRYVPFGLNLEAALKATRILQEEGELKPDARTIHNILENQKLMREFLKRNPQFQCSDFQSNYALLRLPERQTPEEFTFRLLAKGIFVMGGHQFPVPDNRLVRLFVGGPPRDLQAMLAELEEQYDGRKNESQFITH